MENVLRYYEFSDFFTDKSDAFSGKDIAFSELNAQHFLIFEKKDEIFNLYVTRYGSQKEIGLKPPEIKELLVEDYDKSISEHRVVLRKYLY